MKIVSGNAKWHILAWLAYTIITISVYANDVGFWGAVPETSASYIVAAVVFYLHIAALHRFFNGKFHFGYLLALAGILIVNFALKCVAFMYIFPNLFNRPSYVQNQPIKSLLLVFSYQALTFLIFSAGYYFASQMLKREKAGRENDKQTADREKLELENAALRAQINPHFFINTMLYYHGETISLLPEVAEGMEAMMTFVKSSIAETDESGKILIADEVAVVESLITIFSRRFPSAKIDYQNSLKGNFKIIPHVISPFVENAFKHGTYTSDDNTLVIKIEERGNDLYLAVYNKKNNRLRDDSRGIGIRYIKSQLIRHYPGQHHLDIIETKQDYLVTLKIANITHENKVLYH